MGVVWLTLFIVGLCIGSFVNCVVYRLNHNLSPLRGRSICPQCRHQIGWVDNIPLFSFALLGGRCRYCHKPISWQYPLVELATAILTLIIFNFQFSIFNLLITYSLIAIFVSDLRYGTIPDEVVLFGITASLIFLIFFSPGLLVPNLMAAIAAAGFFLFLAWLTGGKGMGMGDVKFVFFMGLFLGFPNIAIALFLAFLTGAFSGVILILLGKKKFGQTIPFGPFLCLAGWLALFWGEKILAVYLKWL